MKLMMMMMTTAARAEGIFFSLVILRKEEERGKEATTDDPPFLGMKKFHNLKMPFPKVISSFLPTFFGRKVGWRLPN